LIIIARKKKRLAERKTTMLGSLFGQKMMVDEIDYFVPVPPNFFRVKNFAIHMLVVLH
jgi:hypothetical protein